MHHDGVEKFKHREKYRCPLADRKNGCKCPNPCSDSKYGRTVHLQQKNNPRLFNIPPRDSTQWITEYDKRTSVERSNKREKIDYKLESGRHRSSKMWYCRLYCHHDATTSRCMENANSCQHHFYVFTNCKYGLIVPIFFKKTHIFPRTSTPFFDLYSKISQYFIVKIHIIAFSSTIREAIHLRDITFCYFFHRLSKKTLYLFVQRIYTPCNILFKFLI